MDDLDNFNKELAEQGNLEAQTVSMNPAHMVVKSLQDEINTEKASELKKSNTQFVRDVKDIADGKIVIMKSAFLKIGNPLWAQYEDGKAV